MTQSYCDITAILLVLDAFTLDFGLPKVLVACCFCNLPQLLQMHLLLTSFPTPIQIYPSDFALCMSLLITINTL